MSTSTTLTPEDLLSLETEILHVDLDPKPLENAQAKALDSLGAWQKAIELEFCGTQTRMHLCMNGHYWRHKHTCHLRFCPKCGERAAYDFALSYQHLASYVELFRTSSTRQFLEVSVSDYNSADTEITRQRIRSFRKTVRKGLDQIVGPKVDAEAGALVNIVPETDRLVARIMFWGVLPAAGFAAIWPKLLVSSTQRISTETKFTILLKQLFKPCHTPSPVLRAEFELAFEGTRQVFCMGKFHAGQGGVRSGRVARPTAPEGDLIPENPEASGNNPPPRKPRGGCTCPICHSPAVESTDWFPSTLSDEEVRKLPFKKLAP